MLFKEKLQEPHYKSSWSINFTGRFGNGRSGIIQLLYMHVYANYTWIFKILEYKNFGLVAASFWLRLRYPKGGGSLCLFWHLATWTEGLIITDAHGYLIKVSLVPLQWGKKVEMLLNWILNWKHVIHLGIGSKVGRLFRISLY